MSIEGFTYDSHDDIWIADGFEGIGWADGSEAYLRDVFERAVAISDYPTEFARFIRDWPSRYHLSHVRVNLLEAIRPLLDRSWTALELGAGTGILTKWLGQAVGEVDAFEGSVERARVNRIRTRGDSNVKVLVGDMVVTPFPRMYDLATLVGVLEYTPAQPGQTRRLACLELLRKIRESLRQDGVLLLAIENRLGAKYWAGCGEDHSSRLFDGILGYPDDSPITFSRKELEALLLEAGFTNQQFYHLHPDYKLPTTVIRETESPPALSFHQWMRGFGEDYSGPREYLMPDPLLMKSVDDAGLLWHFSNSFLVLCSSSPEAVLAEDWLAKKFSNSVRPELHHTVTLAEREGVLRIERVPIRNGQSFVDLGDYTFALSGGEYVSGSLLLMEAYQALMSEHWFSHLAHLCREVLLTAQSRFAIAGIPGQDPQNLLDGSAIDFTLWNITRCDNGSLNFFDTKWTRKEAVPADYVLFRSLFHFFWAAAPFVRVGFREVITSLLRQFYPAFDDARFSECLKAEVHFQETANARELPGAFLSVRGNPIVPRTDCSVLSKLPSLAPRRPLRTAARIWRTQGASSIIRLALFKLGIFDSFGSRGRK